MCDAGRSCRLWIWSLQAALYLSLAFQHRAGRQARTFVYLLSRNRFVFCWHEDICSFRTNGRHHAATHFCAVSTCSRHTKMNIGPMHTYLVSISLRGETVYRFYCTKQFGLEIDVQLHAHTRGIMIFSDLVGSCRWLPSGGRERGGDLEPWGDLNLIGGCCC